METEKKFNEQNVKFFNSQSNLFQLLIVTATQIEKETLHEYLQPLPGEHSLVKVHEGKHTYYLGVFGQYRAVHVACSEMGSVGRAASIVTTMDAISFCKPNIVLMPGIAFGVNKAKQKIGDIIVSERIISYEPQKKGKSKTEYRGKESPASSLLIDRFRNTDWHFELKERTANIFVGDLLSGEKLIDNLEAKEELVKQYPDAKGGEMEGVGIASACDGKVAHWIVVKAICDYADGNKKYGKAKKQALAATSAISLCEYIFGSKNAFSEILTPSVEQNGSKEMADKLFAVAKKQINNAN